MLNILGQYDLDFNVGLYIHHIYVYPYPCMDRQLLHRLWNDICCSGLIISSSVVINKKYILKTILE